MKFPFPIPSGYVKIAIENGPVEIVDFPSYKMVDLSIFIVDFPIEKWTFPFPIYEPWSILTIWLMVIPSIIGILIMVIINPEWNHWMTSPVFNGY